MAGFTLLVVPLAGWRAWRDRRRIIRFTAPYVVGMVLWLAGLAVETIPLLWRGLPHWLNPVGLLMYLIGIVLYFAGRTRAEPDQDTKDGPRKETSREADNPPDE